MDKPRRFSGTHITIMVVALCIASVGAPVAVAASTGSFINITDPVTAAYKARVSAKGSLLVSPRDPVSGYTAKVDSAGRQLVTGSVTVGGKVSVRTTLPGTPVSNGLGNGTTVPAGRHMVIETVSVGVDVTSGNSMGAFLHYTTSGAPAQMFLPITYAHTDLGYANYVAVLAVHLYADPGTGVYVQPYSPTGTVGTAFCTVSGYLV